MRPGENREEESQTQPVSTFHYAQHIEAIFARSLGEVWRAFRDMGKWYTEYTFDDVSGPSYLREAGLMENQVVRLTFTTGLPKDFPTLSNPGNAPASEHYIMKTIKLVPLKEIVAVVWGQVYDWKRYTVFYVFRMTGKGSATAVFVDSYGEAEFVRPLSTAELSEYSGNFTRVWHRSWSEAFANLRKLVEGTDEQSVQSRQQ